MRSSRSQTPRRYPCRRGARSKRIRVGVPTGTRTLQSVRPAARKRISRARRGPARSTVRRTTAASGNHCRSTSRTYTLAERHVVVLMPKQLQRRPERRLHGSSPEERTVAPSAASTSSPFDASSSSPSSEAKSRFRSRRKGAGSPRADAVDAIDEAQHLEAAGGQPELLLDREHVAVIDDACARTNARTIAVPSPNSATPVSWSAAQASENNPTARDSSRGPVFSWSITSRSRRTSAACTGPLDPVDRVSSRRGCS